MDFEKYANSKLYYIFDLITRLMIINIIWFLTSLIGIGIFTFMPATIATYIMVSGVIRDKNFSKLKVFSRIFTKEYLKSQKLFALLLLMGGVLYFDITFFYQNINQGTFNIIGWWISVFVLVIFLLTVTNSFLVYIYFNHLSTMKMLRLAFLFSLGYPFHTLMVMLINVAVIVLFLYVPYLLPLVPIIYMSLSSYLSLQVLGPVHQKILKKKLPISVENYI